MFTCGKCSKEVTQDGQFCPFCGTPAPAPPAPKQPDPREGQVVAGKYKIIDLIDRGGMGQVYRATHLALDRPVALKLLDRALLADGTLVQRFHREARAASRLNHPNSVGIIDFGEAEDGTLFMVMELVPGRSLAQVIQEEFPLSTARVIKIGSQILAALTEAHALGILHCDLKPQNVMLESRRDESDVIKVVDFGIAKLTDASDGPRLTRAGMVCGTPGYMSPEQAQGETLDARSDLYSVGVILYELVTGKLPFAAQSPLGLVGKMLSERPTPPSQRRPDVAISSSLESLILRALSNSREERPSSAEEFRRLLHACAPSDMREALKTPRELPTTPGLPRPSAPGRTPSERPARTALGPSGRPTPAAHPREPKPPTGGFETPLPSPGPRGFRDLLAALPLMAGSVAGAVLVGGLLVWGLTGDDGNGRRQRFTSDGDAPAAPAALTVPAATTTAAAAAPAPQPAPVEAASAPPRPPEPRRAEPRALPAVAQKARPAPAPASFRALASGPPDSLATPGSGSGEGILTVLAEKGTTLTVDGQRAGTAPRELRLPEGTYHVRASHPGHPAIEAMLRIAAGERNRWEVEFEK